jgi:Domain of unknown function (DUF3526)
VLGIIGLSLTAELGALARDLSRASLLVLLQADDRPPALPHAGDPNAGRTERHLRHGTARHQHFRRQAEAYHAAWRAFFVPKILQRARLDSYRDVPQFRYEEETLRTVIGRAAVGVIGLLVPTVAVGWLGLRALRRYPVVG